MTTPFSGEDLVKRSFFSSIINLRINKPNKHPQQSAAPPPPNPWQTFDEQQPCSTWRLQQHDQQIQQSSSSGPSTQNAPERDRALSQQMEDTLYLTSPSNQAPLIFESPNEIFEEIMCECAPFEQFSPTNQLPQQPAHHQQVISLPSTNVPRRGEQRNVWMTQRFGADTTLTSINSTGTLHSRDDTPIYAQLQTRPTNPSLSSADQRPFSTPPLQQVATCESMVCPNCMHTITPIPLSVAMEQKQTPFVHSATPNLQHQFMDQREVNEPIRYPPPTNQPSAALPLNVNWNEHQSQLKALLGNGSVSLEELVKLIVSTVKDTARQSISPTPVQSPLNTTGMSPAEILQRKRQQNNEAAARYRRRQKEAKMTKHEEIQQLTDRNYELRTQIAGIQNEMRELKAQFLSRQD
ncbi:BZIP domain-containing protein [Aphelenchoides besseyi]|nr:BZIP domain-containing protein [Aphelenchoides besseyi]